MHFIEISLGSIMSSAANPWPVQWYFNHWCNRWEWCYAHAPYYATMQPERQPQPPRDRRPEAPRDKRRKRDESSSSPSRSGPKRSHDGSSYSGSKSKRNPGNPSSSSAPRALDLPETLENAMSTRGENLLLVTGEPGSGKTTRVPVAVQCILGEHGLVIVPKRIMATSSCWRLINSGDCPRRDVGFAIGGLKKHGEKIMFVTAEWLRVDLQHDLRWFIQPRSKLPRFQAFGPQVSILKVEYHRDGEMLDGGDAA